MSRCFGLKAKNEEQKQAIKALLDPQIDLVILQGIAGSGKTLLSLAAGLEQVVESRLYKEIIFTRSTMGVGKDIGFLPGTEDEKMAPWAGGLFDNLENLTNDPKYLMDKIKIKSMLFMRGRSFVRRYLIIDEVQNMSYQELKVLLTRCGEGTKVVCLGDVHQIDNKALSVYNNAMTVLISKQMPPFVQYVELPCGERSRLATWVAELDEVYND